MLIVFYLENYRRRQLFLSAMWILISWLNKPCTIINTKHKFLDKYLFSSIKFILKNSLSSGYIYMYVRVGQKMYMTYCYRWWWTRSTTYVMRVTIIFWMHFYFQRFTPISLNNICGQEGTIIWSRNLNTGEIVLPVDNSQSFTLYRHRV